MDDYLKPCPFCGAKPTYCYTDLKAWTSTPDGLVVPTRSDIRLSTKMGYICCDKCGIRQGRQYSTIRSAEKAWNKRAEETH